MTGPDQSPSSLEAFASLPILAPLPTAAERAATLIRENIFEGKFRPGTALPEAALSKALQISRNTVREAFRALMGEHLLTYEAHKGVAVRVLTASDVDDIYTLREIFELEAIDLLAAGTHALDEAALLDPVVAGERAAAEGDWVAAGTANLRFHASLVAMNDSVRMNEFFQRLMTEMRLGFLALDDPESFHAPYLVRNRGLYQQLVDRRFAQARTELKTYLNDARIQVSAAVHRQAPGDR